MYKLIAPAVAAAVIAPTGLALAAGPHAHTAHAAPVGGTQRLSFFAPEVQQKLLDLGDPGFSLGDELIFTDNVLTRKNGPQVGTDGGVCTVIRVTDASALAGTLQCQVTFSLPGGQITAQDLEPTAHLQLPHTVTNAITGGTGRFRGVRGENTVTFQSGSAASLTFLITR